MLKDKTGAVISEFIYDDITPWPVAADGESSLLYTGGDPTLADSWRASVDPGGTMANTFARWQRRYFSDADLASQPMSADTDKDALNNLFQLSTIPSPPPMTLANRITLFRIFLIPVFVALATCYGQSVDEKAPLEWCRMAAVAVYLIAAASDALDGWIARHFDQKSKLGSILDPAADKGLMLAAIITLSVTGWSHDHRFPLWFPLLVITRDVLSISGALLIKHQNGSVRIRPHWTGKVATATQMIAIGWIMLRLDWLPSIVPTATAAAFTVISGMVHLADGVRQLAHGTPAP